MPNPTRSPSFCLIAALALIAAAGETLAADDPLTIEVTAETGLKFDPPRFVVPPAIRVKIVLTNPDSMAHNLVVTAAGEREAIVNAALALGADASTGFVPKSDKVLAAIGVVEPNDAGSVEFTTPDAEGVYPYVCTYPGHGFVMYGAMYVSKDAKPKLPAIADDPNVSPLFKAAAEVAATGGVERRRVQRTFLRDCGPAAIAVSMGDGTSYAFDAGACRLRYVWSGGFIDNRPYLKANGNDFAQLVGRIWYRDPATFPLRIGYDTDPRTDPAVEFLGYRLVGGLPEFHYRVRGDEVRERITPTDKGDGIVRTFEVKTDRPIRFVVDTERGAAFTSDAGAFESGELALSSEQARRFAVTMTRRPGVEPIWYGSMNDSLDSKHGRDLTDDAVKGRAVRLNGKDAAIDTGVKLSELAGGGTITMWLRCDAKTSESRPVLAAGPTTLIESAELGKADGKTWRFVVAAIGDGSIAVSVDGAEPTKRELPKFPGAEDAALVIGSNGNLFFKGDIDESRVYARTLSPAEIASLRAEGDEK